MIISTILTVFLMALLLSLCFVLSSGFTRYNSQVQDIVDDVYSNLHEHAEDNKVFNVTKGKV